MKENRLNQFVKISTQKILADGPPWAKFILLPPHAEIYPQVKKELLSSPNLHHVLKQLADENWGINSLPGKPASFRNSRSYFWTLRFLADLGLSASELHIEPLLHRLQLQQSESGQFILNYHRKKQQTIELICLTAHLADCLIGLGMQNSNTVQAALNFILTTQRHDGGWHCEHSKQNGEQSQSAPSCRSAALFCLRLLGWFGKKYAASAAPALQFFLNRIDSAAANDCCFDGAATVNLNKLRYPPHSSGLDLLNVFDTLSLFPGLISETEIVQRAAEVLTHWNGANLLASQKRIPAWACFNFGHNNAASAWITAVFIRALNRFFPTNSQADGDGKN